LQAAALERLFISFKSTHPRAVVFSADMGNRPATLIHEMLGCDPSSCFVVDPYKVCN
jgi:hypothetical protein